MTIKEASEALDVSTKYLSNGWRKLGLKPTHTGPRKVVEDGEIIRVFGEISANSTKYTQADIAKRLGVSESTVAVRLKELKLIEHKRRKPATHITEQQFRDAHALGLSQSKAGELLGCGQSRVSKSWRKLGLIPSPAK